MSKAIISEYVRVVNEAGASAISLAEVDKHLLDFYLASGEQADPEKYVKGIRSSYDQTQRGSTNGSIVVNVFKQINEGKITNKGLEYLERPFATGAHGSEAARVAVKFFSEERINEMLAREQKSIDDAQAALDKAKAESAPVVAALHVERQEFINGLQVVRLAVA